MKDSSMHYKKLSATGKRVKSSWLGCGFFLLLAGLAIAGCDYHAPTIGELQYRLNLINDLGSQKIYQKLSVLIMAQDQDGFDDLAKIYIIHDKQELYWTVDSSTWRNNNKGVRSFIGSNSLVMPNLANFPDGEYRVVLEDLAGDTTEKSFFLYTPQHNTSMPGKSSFPGSYAKGQKIFINSKQEQVSLWLYKSEAAMVSGDTDNMLSSLLVRFGERGISYQNLKLKVPNLPQEFTYYVYAYDASQSLGLISGPYYYSESF